MEQLTQSLKDGQMNLLEVPFPALNHGYILVRNHFSLVSAGTEGKTVKDARLGYIGKAKARKDEVRKVIQTAKTLGIMKTYQMVMNKLDAPNPLGYCCAGEVIEVSPEITEFRIGDYVACGGNSANHSEVVSVPKNLCVKIPAGVTVEQAAMTTLGSIALQGVRQADLRLGESAAVIGLGLIGQLTIQLLQASGIKTIGIDIDEQQVKAAIQNCQTIAFSRNSEYVYTAIDELTNGFGVDAVIITAGTSSSDPIDFSGEICRQKGKVVVVGAVPTGFKRTNFFKKELDLRMSCSYGPGRYDSDYEEKGIDYPYGYVRWTENRNMESFLQLISSGKISVEPLITHRFNFASAIEAYNMIVNRTEPFLGIILKYDQSKSVRSTVSTNGTTNVLFKADKPIIGFIGAGNFAQNFLLPAIGNDGQLKGISTARPANARNLADKYKFKYAAGSASEIIEDPEINTLFIATRHDSHFTYVIKGLNAGKNVFVEKPLCMDVDELEQIKKAHAASGKSLMVGFNRRFSPLVKSLMNVIHEKNDVQLSINYRINAGIVPSDHWIHDKSVGGGRIIGEACHFIDLASFLAKSKIESVSAVAVPDAHSQNDTAVISLYFKNGSIANISYFSNGNKEVEKENIEVFFNGRIAIINDFKTLTIYGKNKIEKKSKGTDKGHNQEVSEFLNNINSGSPCPIPFEEQYNSFLATFMCIKSISSNGERIIL
ncbi:MAG: bi-domain-containing oxidoreductase [Bacteroidetes bacterium]|nr:bi-domain-containing oxidoreductase [Bacteroidota bacterium]